MRRHVATALVIVATLALVYGWGGSVALYFLGSLRPAGPNHATWLLGLFALGSLAFVVLALLISADRRRQASSQPTSRPWKPSQVLSKRDIGALLSARALGGRAAAGFVFGAFMTSCVAFSFGDLGAGVVASGVFGSLIAVVGPLAAASARTGQMSQLAIYLLGAGSGGVAGGAWWLVAEPDSGLFLSIVIGAVIGTVVSHE